MSNYYDILGVNKEANIEEIKRAYRKKAMQHHPDKGGDEATFKQLQEAYDVLSSEEKRSNYDRWGSSEPRNDFFNFEDFFGMGSSFNRQRKAPDIKLTVELTLSEIIFGTNKKVKFKRKGSCESCNGTGAEKLETCIGCNGTGQTVEVMNTVLGHIRRVTNCRRCGGAGKVIKLPCTKCNATGSIDKEENVEISIPIGCVSGDVLSIQGAGNQQKDFITGDLHLLIKESLPENVRRDGLNLIIEKFISISDAVLGTKLRVEVVTGTFDVEIPNGSEHGRILSIKNKGIPDKNNLGRGDLLIRLNVIIPKIITHEQRSFFEELKKLEG